MNAVMPNLKGRIGLFLLAFFLSLSPKILHSQEVIENVDDIMQGPILDSTTYVAPKPIIGFKGLLPITRYKQGDQTWSVHTMGQIGACTSTIGQKGCAMTCVAMLLRLNGTDANPGLLNTFLRNRNPSGYSNCNILWANAVDANGYAGNTMTWQGSMVYNLATIKSEIDGGDPVVIWVNSASGAACGHFVLVYGYNGTGTNKSDFLVADPGSPGNATFPTFLNNYTICTTDPIPPMRLFNNVYKSTCKTCPNADYYINPTSSWSSDAARSHAVGGCVVYKISCLANHIYTCKTGCGNNATANYNTFMELRNNLCTLLTSNDDGCESNRSSITWNSGSGGYYYLTVRGLNNIHAGNYTMAHIATPNPLPLTAPTGLSTISVTPVSFTARWNGVTGATGYRIDVSTVNNFATFVSGYNDLNVGNVFSYNVTGLTCSTTYYYRVRATNANGPSGNSGVITYSPSPYLHPLVTPTTSWQWHESNHGINDSRRYRVSISPGRLYTFKTGCGDGATATYDTQLYLYNNNCALITSNDDGCSIPMNTSIINWSSGIYSGDAYLIVKAFGLNYGSYKLVYRYTTAKNGTLSSDEVIVISDDNYFSAFPNPIEAGQELSIEGLSENSIISIYSLDGKLIGSINCSENNTLKYKIPSELQAAVYMIKIETDSGDVAFKKLIVK